MTSQQKTPDIYGKKATHKRPASQSPARTLSTGSNHAYPPSFVGTNKYGPVFFHYNPLSKKENETWNQAPGRSSSSHGTSSKASQSTVTSQDGSVAGSSKKRIKISPSSHLNHHTSPPPPPPGQFAFMQVDPTVGFSPSSTDSSRSSATSSATSDYYESLMIMTPPPGQFRFMQVDPTAGFSPASMNSESSGSSASTTSNCYESIMTLPPNSPQILPAAVPAISRKAPRSF